MMFDSFGKRIKELREEKELSRKALAEVFSLKQNAVYEWEARGKQTDYETLCLLADFFDVTVDYLLGREN
jgi:transcriptional regulator with XRE-family HTH domain